ncbi:hypothetical protein ACVIWV_009815 [Bradyrhizobium diazoefficiens]|uniref:hypothetical protein n=1 Tax=Bradyrhizobium TaxID=374 RepID=UPI001B8B3534|nr:hypothetical protein [Bradyrhizobium diazoefficiens]MBR0868047.1 hypothetical protein [Bradyrhizobium diazoefficiens]MBR0892575.1 hypothetical protein [Bradyrhizobium diazoefficiens]MBR0924269.1 hypothetical protein [Bradyrhizobium diazoefficiens]
MSSNYFFELDHMIPAAPKMLQAVSTPNHKQKKTRPGLALVSVIRSCARSTGRSSQCVEVYPCIGGRDEATGKRLHGALEGLGSGKVPIRALYLGGPKHEGAERSVSGAGFWLGHEPVRALPPPL